MKKFNRILSFLMALALLFSLAPAASAAMSIHSSGLFSDDKHRSVDYREAEELLTKLGIVPDQSKTTLNRAETADMLARTALAEYTAEEIAVMYGQGENPFTDVTNEEWSQGHISYVTKTGILEGRNENTFDPSETLNYDDLVYIPIYAGESTTSSRIPEDAEELETNKPFDNYNDRYQSESREAAQIVVDADLIPTYKQQKLYNLYVNAPYTWNDAAQLIAVLELGEEEAAKLEDPVEYARGKGYIPEGKERQHPLTGTDLVRILSMLMGSKVWLESSAGQFASLYGLLNGITDTSFQSNHEPGTTAYESDMMEYLSMLNKLLAHPLKRDNAMQMIYNFLKASMSDGNGTVAEHFGVDMAKYLPPKATATAAEEVYYATAVHTPTQQTVEVQVNLAADEGMEVTIYPEGNNDFPYGEEYTGGESYTVEVPADTRITVDVIEAIITKILSGETVIFDVAEEAKENTDSNTPTHTLSSGSNGNVEWVVTESGMSASFDSGAEDVTVETAELTVGTATVETEADDGTVGEPLTIQINPDTASEDPGEDNGSDPDAQPALMSLRPAEISHTDDPHTETPPVDTPPVETPPVEMPPVEMPPVEMPPVEMPPVETPPVETPPVETPPVETPPVETPPVETPPVNTPPADTPSAEQMSSDE